MKVILFVLFLGVSLGLKADVVSDDPARPSLGKTGQIFTLKLIPGQKRLEVRLAGTPAAQLDPGRLEIFGRVIKTGGGEPIRLKLQAAKDHFEIAEPIAPDADVEFQIKDKKTKKSETLRLEQKTKP